MHWLCPALFLSPAPSSYFISPWSGHWGPALPKVEALKRRKTIEISQCHKKNSPAKDFSLPARHESTQITRSFSHSLSLFRPKPWLSINIAFFRFFVLSLSLFLSFFLKKRPLGEREIEKEEKKESERKKEKSESWWGSLDSSHWMRCDTEI